MFYTYIIYNQERDKIYIGHTEDLAKRIARHNHELPNKSTSFTSKNNGTWLLIHKEVCPTRTEAMNREKQLKSAQGRKFARSLIKK